MSLARDSFDYDEHGFAVIATANKRHCRASLEELRALFHPLPGQPAAPNHPAHWYRAQLLHYGLKPSDTKGTAIQRLLEAINTNTLEVPSRLQKLELKLKQKWETNGCKSDNRDVDGNNTGTKRDAAGAPIATGVTSTGLSVAGGAGINLDTNTSPEGGIKKTKLGSPGTPQAPTRRAAAAASASTRGRGGRTKQTARKSIIGDEPRPEPRRPRPELSSPEQTAKTERVCGPKSSDGQPLRNATTPSGQGQPSENATAPPRQRLGLLNGTYDVSCPNGDYGRIILCLQGSSMWGCFHFSYNETKGVFFLPQRPPRSCNKAYLFNWRGTDVYGDSQRSSGWISFPGGGQIKGEIHADPDTGHNRSFEGTSVPRSDTRSPRSAGSMQAEWDSYGPD